MKVYKPKALIEGHKLGEQYKGKLYVAIPERKIGYNIVYGNKIISTKHRSPVMSLVFDDQYGRKPYRLYYYEWYPGDLVIGRKIV